MLFKKMILMILLLSSFLLAEELKVAQDFKLKDIKGKTVDLKNALEKGPVLIDFWASWCGPCKEEMPIFNELYNKYKEKGLSVYLITIDKGSAIQKAKNFVKSKGFDFTVLFDKNKKVFKKFGCKSTVPVTFVLNQKSEIVFKHDGKGNEKMFEEAILKAFGDNPKPKSKEKEKSEE
ncbi:MAG: TlpA disulfide reductase family protein [Candidatus Delongbacteria bacterium]|jgi:peroxiredoxin|nr:TlpA disulfide reductase family protein [Candidatus Delongbacteria bacterium]